MNIPMTWMRDLTGITDPVRDFMHKMTNAGVKVEGLTTPGAEISGVAVGRITTIEKHPNADKLLITKADIGEKELQIVTGAQNLKVGDYVPVALDGAKLANGLRIKKGKLRGEVSEGMLCSIGELGYTINDYPESPEDGIYVFPEPQPLGADIKPIMEIADEVVEFEIMSNRSDCNSVLGVAREAFAVYGKTMSMPETNIKQESPGNTCDHISVEIQNAELCRRYIGRMVTDVKIAPSPQWLRHRLTMCGVRPINNIVDITNYVMLEYGQPLHAFSFGQVAGNKIIVRNARPCEIFTTMDGVERVLDESMLLIADPEKALAIAGVMGGENSMVMDDASTILFESANFNKTNIRLTSKKLGLRTDSSAKFEKGIDPELAEAAINRAMELIEQLDCGKVMPGMADAYPGRINQSTNIPYSPTRINALLGTHIPADEIETILLRVGINTTAGCEAVIPSFRTDITCEADIAEEIARFHGYNYITSIHVQAVPHSGGRSKNRRLEDAVSQAMLGLGYSQALTFPFESPKVFDKLRIPEGDGKTVPESTLIPSYPAAWRTAITLTNPLGEDFSIMRTLPLDGLLESLAVNYNRRNESARLFEQAFAYFPRQLPVTELPIEFPVLTFTAYDTTGLDYFDIKGDAEQLLASLGIKQINFIPLENLPFMHPGRTAAINIAGDKSLGFVGELHPQVRENYQIGARVYVVMLDMEAVCKEATKYRPAFTPPPKFPSIQRDLAFKVKAAISAAEIEATITERGGPLLAAIKLFDVYQGPQIEEGYKSMAYNLRFRATDRTLADEDVQKPLNAILKHLEQKCGAELRDK